ncbi:hypothetical protein SLS62_008047 [Diatrype stigma]|uniref:Protein kinase domain-containing protein n=1 Tax=Diatrype stigma TaxID=117547 RepID=A0AAN9UKN1_9PEZI
MENSLLHAFRDIGYREYSNKNDVPFTVDYEKMDIEECTDGTMLPIKPRVSVASDGGQLIVKRLWAPNEQNMNASMKREILKEARCLKSASHKHVIRFTTAYYLESPTKPYMGIVMDRADEDIRGYLEGKKNQQERSIICSWFRCLANVVRYVHGRGITHRDIKPPNILVKDGKVLLADFGISKMGLEKTLATTQVGRPRARTPKYASPEVQNGSTRGRSADVFSLGTVFLEMLVAHSYPQERSGLVAAKSSASDGSYAEHLQQVHAWMRHLEDIISPAERWQRMILHLCIEMMGEDRDQRPKIDEVYSNISSVDLPTEAFGSCCTQMIEDEDLTPENRLIEACRCGNQAEVDSLLGQGVSPNIVGAIHQASANGFEGIVRKLLERGANIDLPDHSSQTALHIAAGCGQERVVQTLIEKGAKIELPDAEGRTPLHYASGHGNPAIVQKLLSHKARVSAIDNNQQTALHLAAKGRPKDGTDYEEVIRILLEGEANPNEVDTENKTPIDYARSLGYHDRAKLLGNNAPDTIATPDLTFRQNHQIRETGVDGPSTTNQSGHGTLGRCLTHVKHCNGSDGRRVTRCSIL